MPIDLRRVLTCAAHAAATVWLAVLGLLSGTMAPQLPRITKAGSSTGVNHVKNISTGGNGVNPPTR
jgi:hypothetical protein